MNSGEQVIVLANCSRCWLLPAWRENVGLVMCREIMLCTWTVCYVLHVKLIALYPNAPD